VMIRPVPGSPLAGAGSDSTGLVMQQLLYADEVRSIKDIEIPPLKLRVRRPQ